MFNRLLEERVTRWVASNALAKVTVLDMHTVFTLALDAEPHDTKCTIAERETCLWIDGFHPAPRLQRVVATEVSSGLHRMGLWL